MIIKDSILRRDWDDNYWTNSGGARWAFFAIFVVLIIVVVLGTIRVNKKRSMQGMQPIYGTRWMTPPSYRQSQNQYQQPDHVRDPDLPSAYVPIYTATANEYDMGYYDQDGTFHPNPNAKSPIQHPPDAHKRTANISDTNPNASAASNLPANIDSNQDDYDDNDSINNFYRSSNVATTNSLSNNVSSPLQNENRSTQDQIHDTNNRREFGNSEEISERMPGAFSPPSGPPPNKQEEESETVKHLNTTDSSSGSSIHHKEAK
ncbi:unnamed protein product [Candida verbasci]|uniref:Uncharacterized protein n=1 Tax=Candida verbasci TaxID=1227364 RepID=A0A9W4TYG5_9ASCO|nr:unnamed protein product [Candida verbasci]